MSELMAITMPKWGLMMEEGTITGWLLSEGDAIQQGADLAEIETPKITNVMEAPVSGTLLKIVCEAGTTVPVGHLIGVVGESGTSQDEIDALVQNHKPVIVSDDDGTEAVKLNTVETPNGPITYQEAGEGPPVVLIHGFGGDRNNWLFNIAALSQSNRVISLDLPGHGNSTKSVGDGTVDQLASAVLAVMNAQGISRAILVGHSLGAGVALRLAANHADRVAGLVAISGLGFGGEVSSKFVEQFVSAERRKDVKGAAAMLFADPSLASDEVVDQLLAFKRTDGVQQALEMLAQRSLSAGAARELAKALAGLKIPVLALHGANDQVIPPPGTLPANICGEIIPDAGHMPHMETSSQVNAKIAQFLRDNG